MEGLTVEHVPHLSRYELRDKDGETIGFLEIAQRGDRIMLPYIEVKPELRGRQYGRTLLVMALDQLHEQDKKVVPICPFIAAFFRRNASYRHMLSD
jgi:uncharacterized protein